MSREKSLQKAIVLSLMLTNIWCGAAYADNGADGADGTNPPPKTDAIGSGGLQQIIRTVLITALMAVITVMVVIYQRESAA